MRQVDRDVLPLRVALEHPFERELAADAAFFVATIGVTGTLAETLVDLDRPGLYRVRSARCAANVVRPDVGGELRQFFNFFELRCIAIVYLWVFAAALNKEWI